MYETINEHFGKLVLEYHFTILSMRSDAWKKTDRRIPIEDHSQIRLITPALPLTFGG